MWGPHHLAVWELASLSAPPPCRHSRVALRTDPQHLSPGRASGTPGVPGPCLESCVFLSLLEALVLPWRPRLSSTSPRSLVFHNCSALVPSADGTFLPYFLLQIPKRGNLFDLLLLFELEPQVAVLGQLWDWGQPWMESPHPVCAGSIHKYS